MPNDLNWLPNASPTEGIKGDLNPLRLTPNDVQFAQDLIFDTNGTVRSRSGFSTLASLIAGASGLNYLNGTVILPAAPLAGTTASVFGSVSLDGTNNQVNLFASNSTSVASLAPQNTGSLVVHTSGYVVTPSANMLGGLTGTASPVVDVCNLADNGGTIFSVVPTVSNVAANFWALSNTLLWQGNLLTAVNNTGTFTSTIGSTAVVGVGTAWTSAMNNAYLYRMTGGGAAQEYVGKVQSVTSTTTLTLEKGAQISVAGLIPSFFAVKPLALRLYKGRITTNTASTTVVGSNTKFKSCNPIGAPADILSTNSGKIFRYRDGAYVGSVASVQNDGTLTLSANAGVAMTNEEYFAVLSFNTTDSNWFGNCAVDYYADRYWVGGPAKASYMLAGTGVNYPLNGSFSNSVFFSKKNDPECYDTDEVAGDFITLPAPKGADAIRGIKATKSGLLIFRTNDTFLLTGSSPETFVVRKVLDDGLMNTMTIKKYKNGIIWPGYAGIYFFDGTNIFNLLQSKILTWYKKAVYITDRDGSGVSFTTLRTGSALVQDYYMLSWTANNGTADVLPSGTSTAQQGAYTLVMNMLNGSISFFSNIRVANSVDISASFGSNSTSPTLVMTHAHPFTKGTGTPRGLQGEKIFQDSTLTNLNYDGGVVTDLTSGQTGPAQGGPTPIIHSQDYTFGDATLLKTWKMLLVHYLSNVAMSIAYYGLPADNNSWPPLDTGTVATTGLVANVSANIVKRSKFILRSQAISFRIYPTAVPAASTSQRFKLFWWAVGGKTMRRGRV